MMRLPNISKEILRLNKKTHSLWIPALNNRRSRNFLLKKREISEETVCTFDLRYIPKEDVLVNSFCDNEIALAKSLGILDDSDSYKELHKDSIVFPFDLQYVIGFGFRNLSDKTYFNSKNSPVYLKDWSFFGMRQAISKILKTDWIIIVEGYFDVLRVHELGFTNTLGICGTAMSLAKVWNIRRFASNFLLMFDSDDPGKLARDKVKKLLKSTGANVLSLTLPLEDGKKHDPDSYGLKYPKKLCSKLQEAIM